METIKEIKDRLGAEFMANSDVANLYGPNFSPTRTFDEQFSKVSVENLLFYIVATVIYIREAAHRHWLSEVENTALATRYGTKRWWHRMALLWQAGDSLTVTDDGSIAYSTVNETKQIIKYAAVIDSCRTVYIRVAKEVNGDLDELSQQEKDQFQAYIDDIKPLGVRVIGQSYQPCKLDINATVYYNAQRSASEIKTAVETAVKEYLRGIVFGGVLYYNKLVDAVQAVDDVSDVVINYCSCNNNGTVTRLERSLLSDSGYYRLQTITITTQPE